MSREGFRYYAERIVPLLTTHQMEKHLAFARKFRNNWGLGGGKFLLVMFDEKQVVLGLGSSIVCQASCRIGY